MNDPCSFLSPVRNNNGNNAAICPGAPARAARQGPVIIVPALPGLPALAGDNYPMPPPDLVRCRLNFDALAVPENDNEENQAANPVPDMAHLDINGESLN